MIKRSLGVVLMLAVLLLAAGCSPQHHIQVESDTCWNGSVNDDQYINGCGNSSYKVLGTLRCVKIQKTTTYGTIRVRIDGHPWVATADNYGIIQACN